MDFDTAINSASFLDLTWLEFRKWLEANKDELVRGCEFSIYQWNAHVRATPPLGPITDLQAREMLRPLEARGQITYTEMLHWEVADLWPKEVESELCPETAKPAATKCVLPRSDDLAR